MVTEGLLRPRNAVAHPVTFVELFFDLVFVFGITQVSHAMMRLPTMLGAAQTLILLMALWWSWMGTTWATNWVDPERGPVRAMLFAVMLGGLVMAAAIPRAFEGQGLVFMLSYCLVQLGRTGFTIAAIPRSDRVLRLIFTRILLWSLAAMPFWIAGIGLDGWGRVLCWGAALGIEYASPALRHYVPGLGATRMSDWKVEGAHMSERCGLFVIIALGESVLMTGSIFSEAAWTIAVVAGFLSAFAGTIAMWWIYFHRGKAAGTARIEAAEESGRVARIAYTYLHLPIAAGIILSAVADEMILARPDGVTSWRDAAAISGGPLLFLLACMAFKWSALGVVPSAHRGGCVALVASLAAAPFLSPLYLSVLTTVILGVVAVVEARSSDSSVYDGT